MKKLLTLVFVALGLSVTASAQSAAEKLDYCPAPYSFISIQGGAQTTLTNFNQSKLITPTASIAYGAFFSPVIGARLHVNGMWNKSGLKVDGDSKFTYDYKYVTADVDLLLNLFTLIGKQDYYPLNLYFIGGFGLNYAWDNDDLNNSMYSLPGAWKDYQISHNVRLGLMLDYNLSKHLSVTAEVNANSLSDRYNSKLNSKEDWQLTAQLGLAYKFGFKEKPVPAPVIIPEPEPEPAPVVKEEPKPAPIIIKKPELNTEIFYAIRETIAVGSEKVKLEQLIKFMKDNPEAKAAITGYADAGTGNPRINMEYSRQRAENVAKALTDAGIEASRITYDAKGDTVQPFSENDKNRVSIIIAKGE